MILNILVISLVTCLTLASQLLIKFGVRSLAVGSTELKGWHWILAAMTSWPIILAILIQGVGFVFWVFIVDRMKLGIAFAISGSFFYVLVALASWYLYGEKLVPVQWLALVLISVGVAIFLISSGQ